jgi:hypothetical protein
VVILGAARSGTKMLRDALALLTGTGSVPYDIGYVWRRGNEHRPDDVLDPAAVDGRTRRFIQDFVDRYAGGEPAAVVEKTVGNCLRVPAVAAVLDDAVFVHLVRDGVDVIESARRQWTAPADVRYLLAKARHFPLRLAPSYGARHLRSLARRRTHRDGRVGSWGPRYPGIDDDLRRHDLLVVCARQWREAVTRTRTDAGRIGLPLIEVRYERLVSDPENELAHLARAVGLAATPARLGEVAGRMDATRRGAGRRRLIPGELAVVDAEAGDLLAELGYERPGLPVPDRG